MSIRIREILSDDKISEIVDKINFNFSQVLLNGGGPTGPTGPIGTGAKGDPGENGTNWFSGNGSPVGLTINGSQFDDFFLDNLTGDVYQLQEGINDWVFITNIKGPKGDDANIQDILWEENTDYTVDVIFQKDFANRNVLVGDPTYIDNTISSSSLIVTRSAANSTNITLIDEDVLTVDLVNSPTLSNVSNNLIIESASSGNDVDVRAGSVLTIEGAYAVGGVNGSIQIDASGNLVFNTETFTSTTDILNIGSEPGTNSFISTPLNSGFINSSNSSITNGNRAVIVGANNITLGNDLNNIVVAGGRNFTVNEGNGLWTSKLYINTIGSTSRSKLISTSTADRNINLPNDSGTLQLYDRSLYLNSDSQGQVDYFATDDVDSSLIKGLEFNQNSTSYYKIYTERISANYKYMTFYGEDESSNTDNIGYRFVSRKGNGVVTNLDIGQNDIRSYKDFHTRDSNMYVYNGSSPVISLLTTGDISGSTLTTTGSITGASISGTTLTLDNGSASSQTSLLLKTGSVSTGRLRTTAYDNLRLENLVSGKSIYFETDGGQIYWYNGTSNRRILNEDDIDLTDYITEAELTGGTKNPVFGTTLGFNGENTLLTFNNSATNTKTNYWTNKKTLTFDDGSSFVTMFKNVEVDEDIYVNSLVRGLKLITAKDIRTEGSLISMEDSSGNEVRVNVGSLSAGVNPSSPPSNGIYSQGNIKSNGRMALLGEAIDTSYGLVVGSSNDTNAQVIAYSYDVYSDINLKDDINPLQNALSIIDDLNPVTYKLKADQLNREITGFIAQEVETILPNLVNTKNDGIKVLSYEKIIPINTKAIKELKFEYEDLKDKYNKLEEKLNKLLEDK